MNREKSKCQKNMNYLKNTGITLVALVVTIVVLLILAGISLNLVLGNNGIITGYKKNRSRIKTAAVILLHKGNSINHRLKL